MARMARMTRMARKPPGLRAMDRFTVGTAPTLKAMTKSEFSWQFRVHNVSCWL